jgi:integrase
MPARRIFVISEPNLELIRRWKAGHPLLSTTTLDQYEWVLKELAEKLKDVPLTSPPYDLIVNHGAFVASGAKRGQGARERIWAAVKSFIDWAMRNKLVELEDAKPILTHKVRRRPQPRKDPIPIRFVPLIIEAATSLRARMVACLIFSSGIRIGELTHLRKNDFTPDEDDEECMWINIRAEIAKGGWFRRVSVNLNLKMGKKRTVGSIINEYMETLPPNQPPDAPLFPKRGILSDHLSIPTLSRDFKTACLRAGVPRHLARCHAGRHTYAIGMIKGGAKITEVGQSLGHHGQSTTWIYLKQAEEEHKVVVKQSLKVGYALFT